MTHLSVTKIQRNLKPNLQKLQCPAYYCFKLFAFIKASTFARHELRISSISKLLRFVSYEMWDPRSWLDHVSVKLWTTWKLAQECEPLQALRNNVPASWQKQIAWFDEIHSLFPFERFIFDFRSLIQRTEIENFMKSQTEMIKSAHELSWLWKLWQNSNTARWPKSQLPPSTHARDWTNWNLHIRNDIFSNCVIVFIAYYYYQQD